MDFLKCLVLAGFFLHFLTGCGQEITPETVFEQASDECEGEVVPHQFVARHFDGRMEVVTAESQEAFLKGYVKQHLSSIQFAENDYFVHASDGLVRQSSPGTSVFADNWGQQNASAGSAWAAGVQGQGVVIAVIDTGMDIHHGQLNKQIFVNNGELGVDGAGHARHNNGIDDDGNGFVDDAYGYDFVSNEGLTVDNSYHGTHVAGIIAAEHTDTTARGANYVQGMAPKAKILPLAFLDSDGSGTMSDGVRAMEYAVARGAHVINASWGGPICSRSLRDSISALASHNVIFVSAAGNSGLNVDRFKEYPASLNLAAQITVGATGDHNDMASYSNYGAAAVHLFAPGSSIVSTLPGDAMGALSGTSMATPFVSGAVALLLSAVPNSTASQIRQALYSSATKRSDYINASRGRLNMANAVAELHRITGR